MDFDLLWEKTCNLFPVLKKKIEVLELLNPDEIEFVAYELQNLNISGIIYKTVFLEINEILRRDIVLKFWSHFHKKKDSEYVFFQFQLAVSELHKFHQDIQEILRRLAILRDLTKFENFNIEEDEFEKFNNVFKSSLLSQLPAHYNDIVYTFYSISFKVFVNSHQLAETMDEDEMDGIDEIKCNGCEMETENCRCQRLICAFNKTNEYLTNMNLLDRLSGYTLTSLIQERIAAYVRDTCQGIFDKSHLDNLKKWLESIVFNWLTRIYNRGSLLVEKESKISIIIQDFNIKFSYYLWETYGKIIIEQFFSIIIDYPDSQPAIDDLKVCLEKIDLRQHLITTLKQSLEVRLLHPGVNTMDILTGYVAAIKAIRHLDSSGVLLETVTEPVKEYLRRRNDTVRRVVTGLTEEGPTDLAEELAKSETLKENVDVNGKDEMVNWEMWQPDPVDANPSLKANRKNRSADIISMVVDIYGSKELFVSEYRSLLADRLLTQLDFNPEKEIRNLELLKLRFGESLLHNCEVMLKDISDSKRINTHILSDINYSSNKSFEISSLILSAQYWPTFNKETLELPDEIQEEFKKYTKSYEAYKGNRTLNWRHVTGKVNIEIELANKKLDMTVTPTQAIIIYHFQNKNEWNLEDLSQIMKVPQSILRKRIIFWQTQGLIKETKADVYTLIDESEETTIDDISNQEMLEEDETESAMASASDQREEELQVFWSYIVGMLTNLDSLPIERIHQMLKMFASHGPGIEFSQEELKNFLQRKVREHKLIFAGGVYQLAK
ncbi:anaphase-promoting complex subunit 2 [Condylostylus longicornis]|uniref:anaphase-promoting complex subunit 2 n=1 Tax=Condylostylus longicornis TaxID=2530218 RepID=UPI00244DDD8A|nr:anaphase-promoting complex subunit 2 [Condylostylus longicornis]